jgi:hypothetical protein
VPAKGFVMTTMETNDLAKNGQTMPPVGEHVVVRCPEFSCLGYRDDNGTWKSVFTNETLASVIDFYPIA